MQVSVQIQNQWLSEGPLWFRDFVSPLLSPKLVDVIALSNLLSVSVNIVQFSCWLGVLQISLIASLLWSYVTSPEMADGLECRGCSGNPHHRNRDPVREVRSDLHAGVQETAIS